MDTLNFDSMIKFMEARCTTIDFKNIERDTREEIKRSYDVSEDLIQLGIKPMHYMKVLTELYQMMSKNLVLVFEDAEGKLEFAWCGDDDGAPDTLIAILSANTIDEVDPSAGPDAEPDDGSDDDIPEADEYSLANGFDPNDQKGLFNIQEHIKSEFNKWEELAKK